MARLMASEGGDGRLSSLGFGGTIAAGALMAAGLSTIVAAGARGGGGLGISESSAVTFYDLYATVIATGAAACLAVLLLAVTLVTIRDGGFPAWLGWVSLILAVGSVTPFSYIFIGLDTAWIALVSIWMYTGRTTRATF